MPRLVNKVTGARIAVSESTAARMGSAWAPDVEGVPEPKKPARARKQSDPVTGEE